MSPVPANHRPSDVVGCSAEVFDRADLGLIGRSAETGSAEVDFTRVKQLVGWVIAQGLCLDDPWRHAYLRSRWTGHGST
jgi:hypothetical protein